MSSKSLDRVARAAIRCGVLAVVICSGLHVDAQVRTKKPDRGVYVSPQLAPVVVENIQPDRSEASVDQLAPAPKPARPLIDVGLESVDGDEPAEVQAVTHQEVMPVEQTSIMHEGEVWNDGVAWPSDSWHGDTIVHDSTCDGCDSCAMGCDAMGPMGCDSMCAPSWANSSLSFSRDRWFGSVELLLMFRSGDRLPTLVTTGPSTDADTAGEIGQAGTQVLVGNNSILKDVTAGGRLTLGTWIDSQRCRSLVWRGWFAGEETFDFHITQDQTPVIVRPFLNVSDNQAAEQDTQLVAFPDRASGSIDVRADSEVFGGDISVRQLLYSRFGGTVDVLYGYQYMRLNGDLSISSTSTSLDDNFAPLGSIIAIADSFETQNEFHGGQLGVSSRYREGCWSFNSLAKVAFGSLRRRGKLTGSTFTSIDGANATDPNGLLVRSTNSGTSTDHTFGWVPELDFTLGWQRYPNFDVTVGYHVIAMTEALQASDAIDRNLAVNLSDPPTGQQSPSAAFAYDTFYVQGIHFGLQYVY